MADAGAAIVIGDAELTGARLRAAVDELVGDRARLAHMAAASRDLARPDAARDIAREVLAAAGAAR
jgi:UDP-N-acetylglucosamine--N-acetylmuramyl-(pentapeptide) pyrophosphoryl-undecaprenol N-acetylglucosamine transferase